MDFRPLHDEINGRFLGSTGLRPDPGDLCMKNSVLTAIEVKALAADDATARLQTTSLIV